MSSISNILSQLPDFQQLSSNAPFAARTLQFQAQAQTSTTSNFSFFTAEGDRVTLSTGSESNFSFESYNFLGLTKGQAVDFQSRQLSTSFRSEFNLHIEGDLNEQEQADIQAFIQSAKGILQDVAAGNVENATETAISLNELESLSSASLFFRQTTAASLALRSTDFAVQGNAHANDSRGGGINEGTRQGHNIEHILDKIKKAQEKFQLEPEKLAKRLPRLLTKLVKNLDKPLPNDESSEPLFEQIRQELFPSLLQATKNLEKEERPLEKETEEAKNLEEKNPVPSSNVQNEEILATLLNESKET